MNLLEIGEYLIGEPVYEVKASPRIDNIGELHGGYNDIIVHKFFQSNGFDFSDNKYRFAPDSNAPKSLQSALNDSFNGVYYCLIKNGAIVSMQYVGDESHVRMVED